MNFGPACERCGANSREYEPDGDPPRCPFCRKHKRRGTREELLQALRECERVMLNAVGFLAGQSIMPPDMLKQRLVDAIERVQDV